MGCSYMLSKLDLHIHAQPRVHILAEHKPFTGAGFQQGTRQVHVLVLGRHMEGDSQRLVGVPRQLVAQRARHIQCEADLRRGGRGSRGRMCWRV